MLKRIALYLGPLAAVLVGLLLAHYGLPRAACLTAAVTTLCAVWWVFEPIPLPATSLIPFAAFPLLGILSHQEVATAYGHHLVLLMLAGSMISTAMEKSDAHRRVALGMVRLVGRRGASRVVLGFLLASASLSMWISNTATTVMLLPVALAVIHSSKTDHLAVPLLLAVAYGAAVGGSGTPIGTPPNLIFIDQYEIATGNTISFLDWMKIGVPVVIAMLPVVWLWLIRRLDRAAEFELPELGPWRSEERRVLTIFALTAMAWITRSVWAPLLGVQHYAGDSTVAITAAVVMFVCPSGDGKGGRLLDWQTAVKIPWGVFIMIGGGIAIGKAFHASELSAAVGNSLAPLTTLPEWLVFPGLCLMGTFLTEVTSNTATANVLMPILAAAGTSGGIDPIWLMIPAALGLNHAFMLPVATAPNAIVYGTGRVSTATMAREGFALNLFGMLVICLVCSFTLRYAVSTDKPSDNRNGSQDSQAVEIQPSANNSGPTLSVTTAPSRV